MKIYNVPAGVKSKANEVPGRNKLEYEINVGNHRQLTTIDPQTLLTKPCPEALRDE